MLFNNINFVPPFLNQWHSWKNVSNCQGLCISDEVWLSIFYHSFSECIARRNVSPTLRFFDKPQMFLCQTFWRITFMKQLHKYNKILIPIPLDPLVKRMPLMCTPYTKPFNALLITYLTHQATISIQDKIIFKFS